jgi:uncharacterized Zn-binding protein involved in type VI secretion
MPAVTRIGDSISCGDTIAEGSGNVFSNGIPVSREGDRTAGHCYPPTPLIPPVSPDVFVNGISAAHIGTAIQPHTCGTSTHGGNVVVGSTNVFVNSLSGAGAVIDNNPPYTTLNTPSSSPFYPPVHVQTDPAVLSTLPDGFAVTSADVYVSENNDDPDGDLLGPPSGVSTEQMEEREADLAPAPSIGVPVQDCSDIESFPSTYTWKSGSPLPADFSEWANAFELSPNYTVADLTIKTAVSYYEFSESYTQLSGETQKDILLNMCFLAKTILEPLRELYGNTFIITSAFRNKSGTSQHNKGQAVDIQFLGFHSQPNTGELYFERAQHIRDNLNFDQLILEWFGRNPWIHISANPDAHRNNVLTQTSSNTFTPGLILLKST